MATEAKIVVTVEMVPVKDSDPLLQTTADAGITLEDFIKSLKLPQQPEVALVNGGYVRLDYQLQNGDKISIFPLMAGG